MEKFTDFFRDDARTYLNEAISLALREDGPDVTSNAIFSPEQKLTAKIIAKQDTIVAGLPLIALIMDACGCTPWEQTPLVEEGAVVTDRTVVTILCAQAACLLKAERVILNFITHLSGIANLTAKYAKQLEGTGTRLLDTRKTLPGLRYPEKYAVLLGGGVNHRKNLAEMCMLKDNHIDLAGGIIPAVTRLRATVTNCPPIEVECRTLTHVREAVSCHVDRIMLDNMEAQQLNEALALIPNTIETEVSGGVTLETIRNLATASSYGPNFISVGRLTHSAPGADFSMLIYEADT